MDELQRQYRRKQVGRQERESQRDKLLFFPQCSLPHIVKNTIKWPDKRCFLSSVNVFPIKIGSWGEIKCLFF